MDRRRPFRLSPAAIIAAAIFLSLYANAFALIKDRPGAPTGGENCGGCHASFDAAAEKLPKPDGTAAPGPEAGAVKNNDLKNKPAAGAVEVSRITKTARVEKFDTVVIGGGLSGLSALHFLGEGKNLLLESEPVTGGQMKRDEWKGIKFAVGTSYCGEPYGVIKRFFDETGIKLKRIDGNDSTAFIGGKFYRECWGDGIEDPMPWSGKDALKWKAFLDEMRRIAKEGAADIPFSGFDEKIAKLDNITAREYMVSKGLTKQMIDHVDLYIRSCFGEPGDKISAAAFISFISGDMGPGGKEDGAGATYTVPGGMGEAIAPLYEAMKDRIRTSCTVFEVAPGKDGITISYVDGGGKTHSIEAESVIMAVAARHHKKLIKGLSKEKTEAISKISYAGYVTAAVLCREDFWGDRGYDTSFSGEFFTDIIDADWMARGGKPRKAEGPHVLSVYAPVGTVGVYGVMTADTAEWKEKILSGLEKVSPGCRSKIEDIRFYRFGHTMHVAAPGFMSKIAPVLRKPFGGIFFAGVESEGLPSVEAAILAGHRAAKEAKAYMEEDD